MELARGGDVGRTLAARAQHRRGQHTTRNEETTDHPLSDVDAVRNYGDPAECHQRSVPHCGSHAQQVGPTVLSHLRGFFLCFPILRDVLLQLGNLGAMCGDLTFELLNQCL